MLFFSLSFTEFCKNSKPKKLVPVFFFSCCGPKLLPYSADSTNQFSTFTLSRLGIYLTPPPNQGQPHPLQSSTRRPSACTTHQPLTCGGKRRGKCSMSAGSSQPGVTSRSQPLARAEVATAANANANAAYSPATNASLIAWVSGVSRLLEEAVGSCLCTSEELRSEQRPLQGSARGASHGPGTIRGLLPKSWSQNWFDCGSLCT